MLQSKKHIPFYLLVFTLFLILVSPFLLADGMFMDGLLYATISNNMGREIGSIWKPYLTESLYPEFYEHPPLAFYLQSLWIKVFGNSIWVEKFYSLLTFVLVGIGIVKIWKIITNDIKYAWIPLLFWVIIPDNFWAASNNILENTMSVFVVFSALFYLLSRNKNRVIHLALSGLFLTFAFLTKGFTGLYIFGLPFVFWVFSKNKKGNIFQFLSDTFLLVLFAAIPLILLFWAFPESYESIKYYITSQVINSVQNKVTVGNRFQIIIDFFSNILPVLILGFVFLSLIFYYKKDQKQFLNYKKYSAIFIGLAFAGVLPIMVSLKQRGFYIVTVYPFFSIGFGLLFYTFIKKYIETIDITKSKFKIGFGISLLGFIFSLFLVFSSFNKSTRDKEKIKVSHLVKNIIKEEKEISACPELRDEWSLHGYFMRNSNISFSTDKNVKNTFYFTNKSCQKSVDLNIYESVSLDSEEYFLFKKK